MSGTADTDKLVGVVTTVKEWPSGKGYFLNLDNSSNDYFGYSKCRAAEQDRVQLEFKAGSGNFSDKMQIIKLTKLGGVGQNVENTTKNEETPNKQATGQHFQSAAEKSAEINRAVALKTATELMKVCVITAAEPKPDEQAEITLGIAEKFLDWLKDNGN